MRRRMGFRRGGRFRRRGRWLWGDNFKFQITEATANAAFAVNIFPSGLVEFLNGGRPLVVKRILMWLQFSVFDNRTDISETFIAPDMNVYIIKTAEDVTGAGNFVYQPFATPTTPSNYTAWQAGDIGKTQSPFLWCTRLFFPMPPPTADTSGLGLGMSQTGDPYYSANPSVHGTGLDLGVRNVYQPQLDLRVKRKIQRDECLIFAAAADAGAVWQNVHITWQFQGALRVFA